ncbi:hypothetical protein RsTz2092_02410 [Deferribacterales bacterium RsTz2092]|nr:hypothetical protein AGMMS49941_08390 [Deferribacterales bacterium]
MVKKTISIADDVYAQVKGQHNFSGLVSMLLTDYIQRANVEKALGVFGAIPSDIDGVTAVNAMRSEGELARRT